MSAIYNILDVKLKKILVNQKGFKGISVSAIIITSISFLVRVVLALYRFIHFKFVLYNWLQINIGEITFLHCFAFY